MAENKVFHQKIYLVGVEMKGVFPTLVKFYHGDLQESSVYRVQGFEIQK